MKLLIALFAMTLIVMGAAPVPPYKPSQFSTNAPGAIMQDPTTWSNPAAAFPITVSTGVVQVLDPANVFINVKSLGAKGDGSIDDSGAIQDGVNLCSALPGSTLLFPPTPLSFYRVTTTIFATNGLRMVGYGATIRGEGVGTATSIFDLQTQSGFPGGSFEGIHFTTTLTNVPVPPYALVSQDGQLNNVTIKDCTFENLKLLLSNSPLHIPVNVTNLVLVNNTFSGDLTGANPGAGNVVSLAGLEHFQVSGNYWLYQGEEQQLLFTRACFDGIVANNTFKNSGASAGNGRVINGQSLQHVTIANNSFDTLNYPGVIYLKGGDGLMVNGNRYPAGWNGFNSAAIELDGTIGGAVAIGNNFGSITNIPFINIDATCSVSLLSTSGNQGTTDQLGGIVVTPGGSVGLLLDANNFLLGP